MMRAIRRPALDSEAGLLVQFPCHDRTIDASTFRCPEGPVILVARHLLTMHRRRPHYIDGAIVLEKGYIGEIGPASRLLSAYPHHPVIRLHNAVLLPGLVNLHTHLELPPLLERVRAKSFPEWVLNLVRAKKALGDRDYRRAAKQNIADIIRSGATTVGEISTHHISSGYLKDSGLRATVFQEIISMNPDRGEARIPPLFRTTSLLRAGISPHAPYTVSEMLLREISDRAKRRGIPLCMHVAESRDESRLLQGKQSGFHQLYRRAGWDIAWAPRGESSFAYLDRIGVLAPSLLAVHAVQVSDDDIDLIKKSHVPLVHCPRSNRETGVGRMALKKILNAGIAVGIGTDSLASSPSLNLWDEMRFALKIHRRDGVTAGDILGLATAGGAKALGRENELGTLEAGKRADIIAVPLPGKNTGNIYSDLLRETNSCIMSLVGGSILKK